METYGKIERMVSIHTGITLAVISVLVIIIVYLMWFSAEHMMPANTQRWQQRDDVERLVAGSPDGAAAPITCGSGATAPTNAWDWMTGVVQEKETMMVTPNITDENRLSQVMSGM